MFHICDLLGLSDFVEAFLNIGFELVEFVSVVDRDTQKGGDENTYRSERGNTELWISPSGGMNKPINRRERPAIITTIAKM